MNRVCIFIGEGISERYFLPSLLQNQLGFKPLFPKVDHLYTKDEKIFWLLPFPPKSTIPIGGRDRLFNTQTYKDCCAMHAGNSHLFGNHCVDYRILIDSDGGNIEKRKKQVARVQRSFKKGGKLVNSCQILFVENEIENWYFAGLTTKFPYFKVNEPLVTRLLAERPEQIIEPKDKLASILNFDSRNDAIKLAQVVGEYFDIERAIQRSSSFKAFYKSLERLI